MDDTLLRRVAALAVVASLAIAGPAHARGQVKRPVKRPNLSLKSSLSHRLSRAALLDARLPFTVALRRSYEGGPGDDVLGLDWDSGVTPWPLAGTGPATTPVTSHLDGAFSYEWDFGADTTGYATAGTVETLVGGGVALTGSGFPIATAEGACTTAAAIDATGITFASAAVRFGTVNPFSGAVSGTLSLRTAIRTRVTPCGGGAPTTALARTGGDDPPLPVAFDGRFTVSPAVTADGRMRLGVLRIADTVAAPQRTTFGLIQACTDPAAADGCGRRAFPARTRMVSLTADVLAGDAMPVAPADPAEPPPL
jgi:hypothetical protein